MQVLAPLDALRRDAMAAVLARPRLGAILTRRDARLVVLAVVGIALALATSCALPAAALVLAPVVLGVPHVASDVRYLVLRRGLGRAAVVMAAAGCAAMLALRVAEGLSDDASAFAGFEIALGATWVYAAVLVAGAASRAWGRALAVLGVVGVLAWVALRDPERARVVLAHGHNLVGVGLWVLFFRRARRPLVPVAVALAVALAIAVTGAPLRIAHALGTDAALGMTVDDAAAMLAPGLTGSLAAGLVASYVLLQSVHYAVWLGWIPQDDVRGEGTLTFGMTARGFLRDFRPIGVVAVALGSLAVVLGALVSARGARDTYLTLASFHAYLELAMLGYFVVAGLNARASSDTRAAT